ncbi:polyphosphate polymerase domain-containing protein [Rhodocytophaga aerolata]|uniref:Polyphosphate polymerase domain-containing protein n=1 Tax=Rhodocytophaga aerolata TaxID=455078 RepID=A0ABT8RIQ9_9BACT|nr:polyphosphate polymerase domain-containing protein [Rhodocytophaga aerolata]MDO1450567.1 polyphosphate polymerase domain-containing protein [Rhodocytophaga aerolata]
MIDLVSPGIIEYAGAFESISLAQIEAVKLMNRVDAKFLIPVSLLPALLSDLLPSYQVLEVNNYRLCEYQTLYFDTPDFRLYHEHQRGRHNRYKIRQRYYVQSDTAFTEVKFKNNKGRTIKTRIQNKHFPGFVLDEESKTFLAEQTPFNPASLQPMLWVDYTRLTLVHRTSVERLTLDLNLSFRNATSQESYPQVVIAEVKQESLRNSYFLHLMKQYQLREGSISKYCLGVISLYHRIKQNRFKAKLRYLQKLNSQSR